MVATKFVQISRSQKISLFLTPTFNLIKAPLADVPVWSTDNFRLVTLRPSTDGLQCDVLSNGDLGVCNVTVNAVGQTSLSITTQVTIISNLADDLSLDISVPVPQ